MGERMKKMFMQDWFFIVILTVMGAAVYTTTNLYLTYGVGSLNNVTMILMLKEREWVALGSMGVGIVIARILEGPMVGLIDIGGGVMVCIGTFAVAMTGMIGGEFILESFPLSLIVGAAIGLVEGAVIIGIRKLIPAGIAASGSDIMMGVGHSMSSYMAPLFIICALGVSVPMGIFAALGGAVFFARGKNPVGGIMLGMFASAIIWA